MSASPAAVERAAVAMVKRWMQQNGYSTMGGDNFGFLMAALKDQIWTKVRTDYLKHEGNEVRT